MHLLKVIVCSFAFVAVSASSAYAGPYTDELSKCLVDSTSVRDRAALVRWMFAAISLHPAVKSLASVSKEQLEEANKGMAELSMKLLTDSCRSETKKALKYEGAVTIEASFNVLGQVAGRELFADSEVSAGISNLDKYFDKNELKSLVEKD